MFTVTIKTVFFYRRLKIIAKYFIQFDNGYEDEFLIQGSKEECENEIREIQEGFLGLIVFESIKWV